MQDCIRYKDAIEPTFSHWQDPKDKTSFSNEPYKVHPKCYRFIKKLQAEK